MKALAVLLYAMGNVSFCSIARILGVSDVAVLNWFRDKAHKLPEPKSPMPVRSMPMESAKFMAAGLGVID